MTSRRDAVRALGGLAMLPLLGRAEIEALLQAGHRALTPAQYGVVEAAAERIIPRTATPGATDARVADFVDVMLADWYDGAERARVLRGVDALAASGFARADAARQTRMLEALDREAHAGRSGGGPAAGTDVEHWFATLKHLTVWGYYTSRPGMIEELRAQLMPGRYDGNAAY